MRAGSAPGATAWSLLADAAERRRLPDFLIRIGIRVLLHRHLRALAAEDADGGALGRLLRRVDRQPIAIDVEAANRQHYEVPAEFFRLFLGPRWKYSACDGPVLGGDLGAAEDAMLELSAERARLEDGQIVLDLGCGWGAFTFWIAERFPTSRVLAISNSSSQIEHVRAEARRRRLSRVAAERADVNEFDPGSTFDRVLSVEMMEHCRGHRAVLARMAQWLRPEGRLFLHVFAHARHAYLFETGANEDWMARHFFTGGMMPSIDLLPQVADALVEEARFWHEGTGYAGTLRAWRDRLDRSSGEATAVLAAAGAEDPPRALQRWRIFLLACEELFAFRGGREWGIAQYRFRRREP